MNAPAPLAALGAPIVAAPDGVHGGPAAGDGGAFAELVTQLLADKETATPVPPTGAVLPDGAAPAAPACPAPADGPAQRAGTESAEPLPTGDASGEDDVAPAAGEAPTPATLPGAAWWAALPLPGAVATLTAAATAPADGTLSGTVDGTGAPTIPAAGPGASDSSVPATPESSPERAAGRPTDPAPSGPTPEAADPGTPSPSGTSANTGAAAPTPDPARAPAGSTTPMAGPVPVSATGASAPTAPAATTARPAPLAHQVFPEVVTAVQTGTQRVTVRLQPEALGEVRVVLSTHRGELRVSLAAHADAQRALTEGAPELRRLLEAVGGGDARIVVRDLPSTSSQPGPTAGGRQDALAQHGGGLADTGTGRPGGDPDRSAPTHGRSNATDGTPDPTDPSRRTESVTRARAAGLDVTM